ncbi:MAG: hypothetical protein MJA27_18005 [Pseudanabaenales cyanobacterium]|nr:hypothetical protein [Pseudanabaenales cyanobacterium]
MGNVLPTEYLWDAASGQVLATLNDGDVVGAITFSPDGQSVATVSWDGTARLWDAASGEVLATLNYK